MAVSKGARAAIEAAGGSVVVEARANRGPATGGLALHTATTGLTDAAGGSPTHPLLGGATSGTCF